MLRTIVMEVTAGAGSLNCRGRLVEQLRRAPNAGRWTLDVRSTKVYIWYMADNNTPVISSVSEDEAWQLFSQNTLGHLAFIISDAPEVLPVNYVVHNGSILVRTAPGTKLFGVTANPRVAFETESYTETEGWSVVAKGTAQVLTSDAALVEADAAGLKPWVPTVKENVVRIVVSEISGRRFAFGPEPEVEPEGAA